MAQARIPIPTAKDAPGVLALATSLTDQVAADGADSPISGELRTQLATVAPKLAVALRKHQEAKALAKQLERLYEERDLVVTEALPLVQRASKVLQGAFGKDNLRKMGPYGYTVNDTPAK